MLRFSLSAHSPHLSAALEDVFRGAMSAQQRAYVARRVLRRANQPAAVSAYVRELLRELGMGAT